MNNRIRYIAFKIQIYESESCNMLTNMLFHHLVTLFLILLFSIKLWSRKSFRGMETKYFWVPVLSCLVLVIEDTLELFTAQDRSMRF